MIASFYNIEPDSSHVRESQYSIKNVNVCKLKNENIDLYTLQCTSKIVCSDKRYGPLFSCSVLFFNNICLTSVKTEEQSFLNFVIHLLYENKVF